MSHLDSQTHAKAILELTGDSDGNSMKQNDDDEAGEWEPYHPQQLKDAIPKENLDKNKQGISAGTTSSWGADGSLPELRRDTAATSVRPGAFPIQGYSDNSAVAYDNLAPSTSLGAAHPSAFDRGSRAQLNPIEPLDIQAMEREILQEAPVATVVSSPSELETSSEVTKLSKFRRIEWKTGGLVTGLLVAVVIVSVSLGTVFASPSSKSQVQEGTLLALIVDESKGLQEGYDASPFLISDLTSPQHRAYQWLLSSVSGGSEDQTTTFYLTTESLLQRYAAATFYYATNGDTWTDNTSWLSNLPLCDWLVETSAPGIPGSSPGSNDAACQGDSLTKMNLVLNELRGTVPVELGLLKSLESIKFQANYLEGTLPASLSRLSSIRTFAVGNCRIAGTLPSEYHTWTNLVNFGVEFNPLTGTFPADYSTWEELQSLHIEHTDLSGEVPQDLCTALNGNNPIQVWASCEELSCTCCRCCAEGECLGPYQGFG